MAGGTRFACQCVQTCWPRQQASIDSITAAWLHTDTLWVEKYKPQSAQELVGNNSHVATLRQWLHQWEDVHLRGATPVQPRTGGGYQVGRAVRAALAGTGLCSFCGCAGSNACSN